MSTAKQAGRKKSSSHFPLRESSEYLAALGQRVRTLRARRGMTRKMLAARSGVSERFLAQVEAGQGNASILNLREMARALNVQIESLVIDGPETAVAFTENDRHQRIALVGLRGAGKSTLGPMLANQLGLPFFELDRLIEKASGVPLSSIFDLYGQSGFRRLERRCLEEVLGENRAFVLATGGSLVSEPATYERLLASCYTVWLRAEPEDHMSRVIAQGDTRPMAQNPEAMSDLKRILLEREPLYGKADWIVDTSQVSSEAAVQIMLKQVER